MIEAIYVLMGAVDRVDRLPVQLADRIAERTDGVPLFVEELTRSIQESGKAASLSIQNQA
jgi:predicted ATPase